MGVLAASRARPVYRAQSGRDGTMASIPPHWIKAVYACRGWLPASVRPDRQLCRRRPRSGNKVVRAGQVIVFGRDFDRKCVLWKGRRRRRMGKWLASFVDELESGDGWEADKTSSSMRKRRPDIRAITAGKRTARSAVVCALQENIRGGTCWRRGGTAVSEDGRRSISGWMSTRLSAA